MSKLEVSRISRVLAALRMSRPFALLLGYYIFGMLLFTLARVIFIATYSDALATTSWIEIVRAALVGLRFDQVIVLSVLLLPTTLLPWLPLASRWTQRVLILWVAVSFSVALLILLIDIRFFNYFGAHLNFLALEYLDSTAVVWHLVVTEPMFAPFIVTWGASCVLIWWIIRKYFAKTSGLPVRYGRTPHLAWVILSLVLIALGIRGRTDRAPLDWSVAYFSQNPVVNQVGLNGVFTLARAMVEEGRDLRLAYLPENRRFPFVDSGAALDTVRAMLSVDGEFWLEPETSVKRVSPRSNQLSYRPNVVLIIMESWSGRNTGVLGSSRGLTPRFDSLAAHGMLFTDFYANGSRTSYGLAATLCSFPALPGRSILRRYNANHPFLSLPQILAGLGYINVFGYGGDLVFDNMEGFFTTKGYHRMLGQEFFGAHNSFAKWGVPDHIVFDQLADLTDTLPRPFNLTVLTLSNHEPFALPDSSMRKFVGNDDTSKVFNAQLYADWAVGRFIDEMRQRPAFDSTLFVFVSDHARIDARYDPTNAMNFHVPLLIYGPGVIGEESERIDRIGSQVDILPTLLGLIGVDGTTHESWGRNLLDTSLTDSGYAVISNFDRIAIIEKGLEYREMLGRFTSLIPLPAVEGTPQELKEERPDDYQRLQARLRSFMQAAEQAATPLPPSRAGMVEK